MAITKEQAIDIMKERGYEIVSEAGNETWVAFAKTLNNFPIHATVYLERESMSMTAGVLKLACKLSCESIDINTKRFVDFEKTLYFYAKVCSEIDELVENQGLVKKLLSEAADSVTEGVIEDAPEKKSGPKKLNERIAAFKKEVIDIGKKRGYSPTMCKKFFEYWSETNSNGLKMRWEIMKAKKGTFNVERRMITWAGNEGVFNATFKDRDEKKAEKLNTELKKEKTIIQTKELF